ncbi:hypothetical protein APSETT445_006627 [Aspergillus pseudonomiae]
MTAQDEKHHEHEVEDVENGIRVGNAKVLNKDTGNDLLSETEMSNYQYTSQLGKTQTPAGRFKEQCENDELVRRESCVD